MGDPLLLAYMAGVIDSDGCITIHRSVRNGVPYYGARISIAGTRREPHDLAAGLWGGSVGVHYPRNTRHRPQFQWSRTGRGVVPAVTDVLPYLRVKIDQARLALDLEEHLEYGRGPDPFPWAPPDYDPTTHRQYLRDEIVAAMAASHDGYPDEVPA